MSSTDRAFFIVNRLALIKGLRQIKTSIGRQKCDCELTLINDLVTFKVSDATFAIKVRNMGSAKASFEFKPFCGILKTHKSTYKSKELMIEIWDDLVTMNEFWVDAATTFLENDKVSRSIILPPNFTDLDLISLSEGDRYTIHELRFNNVLEEVNQAEIRLEDNLDTAATALKEYGIKREQIEQLINKKVKKRLADNPDNHV